MSLLFNMRSRLGIAFLSRRKRLLISWLQSPSAVILEPKEIKSVTVSIISPSIYHGVTLMLGKIEGRRRKSGNSDKTRLDEAQPGIRIARRNISNLRYVDGTTLFQKTKN